MSIDIYWLIFGVVCFALEASGLTGIGLFFSGLGAISLAILMQLGLPAPEAYVEQFAWFFGFTCLWAAILWKPIKHYRMKNKSSDYSNMVGDRCTVVGVALTRGVEGNVKWSGTTMVAELAADSTVESLAVGDAAAIKEVKGNKLFVDKI